jgi:hypothetical protein
VKPVTSINKSKPIVPSQKFAAPAKKPISKLTNQPPVPEYKPIA